jgi:hypothetical protein
MKPTDHGTPRKPSHGRNFPYDDHSSAAGGHGPASDEMHNDDVAHEHSDINIAAILMSGVVVFVVCTVTAGLMYALFGFLEGQAKARDPQLSPVAAPATVMPATRQPTPEFGGAPTPKLLTDEPSYLRHVREREQTALGGYGWVDQGAGVARISIDRAKQLMVERGLPVRAEAVTDTRLGTRAPAFGEASSGRVITNPITKERKPVAPGQEAADPGHAKH